MGMPKVWPMPPDAELQRKLRAEERNSQGLQFIRDDIQSSRDRRDSGLFSGGGAKGTSSGGTGDVVGPSASVASEIALFDGTTGKLLKRATNTGMLKAASGVIATAAAGTDYVATGANSNLTNLTGLTGSIATPTDITLANNGTIDAGTGVGNAFKLRARATTGGTWVDLAVLTNAALAPTWDFPTGATWNANYIYHATGTDVPITDGGTGQSTAPLARIALTAEDRTVMRPVAVLKTNATSTSITTSDLGVVSYYGRAYASVASGATVTLTGIVTTAWVTAGTTPWCEVAILKGTRPARGANPTLTCVGTLAIASAAGTGVKDYVITLTADINAGDELWVGSGSKATSTRQTWRSGLADEYASGMVASKGTLATFSGLGSTPTAFTVDSTSSTPVFYLYLPS